MTSSSHIHSQQSSKNQNQNQDHSETNLGHPLFKLHARTQLHKMLQEREKEILDQEEKIKAKLDELNECKTKLEKIARNATNK